MIWIAASAVSNLILNSGILTGIRFVALLNKNEIHERCELICNAINKSMHAPTIMTLIQIVFKILHIFPTEKKRICTSFQKNLGLSPTTLAQVQSCSGQTADDDDHRVAARRQKARCESLSDADAARVRDANYGARAVARSQSHTWQPVRLHQKKKGKKKP